MPIETLNKRDQNNRRQKSRFPIHRELRYKLLQDGRTQEAGLGQTVNMGSGGVAFSLDREFAAGTFIELSISWPVLLENATPMRLVIVGRILRSGDGLSACTVDKYEFRTQARTTLPITSVRSDVVLQRWTNRLNTKLPSKFGSLGSLSYGNVRG